MSKHYEPGLYITDCDGLEVEEYDRYGEGYWYMIGGDVDDEEPGGDIVAGPFSVGHLLVCVKACEGLSGQEVQALMDIWERKHNEQDTESADCSGD